MRIAVYPGSFDPITNGHMDILTRATKVFDRIIVLLAINPAKKSRFSLEKRKAMIEESIRGLEGVSVDIYEGLTVDYCRKVGATHIIRGLRAVTDFDYEFQMAGANRFVDPNIDMVFFMASNEHAFISSSTVNELALSGADISSLVPPAVAEAYKK